MENLKDVIKEIMPNLATNQESWIRYFEEQPELKRLISSNQIPKETILKSLTMLNQYLEEKKNCESCKGIESCPNLLFGHYTKLNYEDNYFMTNIVKCKKMLRKEQETYKKKLFKGLYIAHDILDASFKSIDQKPGREEALMSLLKFCSTYQEGSKQKGVYLYGPLGVGKSYLMAAAANKLAEKGISTLMVYVPDFFREMKSSIQDQTLNEKMEALKNVEVLILDDIGAETISQWERDEILGAILQARMVKGLPALYTSNLNYDSLEEHLAYSNKGGEEGLKAKRLMERIRHYTISHFVDGPNRRIANS